MSVSEKIIKKLKQDNIRYFASDNISEYVNETDLKQLKLELEEKFNSVLDTLIIDRENDPNSHETGHRLAKMYVDEIMSGRYEKAPKVTSFPNADVETRYRGLLNSRTEFRSLCSHHHQPVKGICFIGLLPSTKVIGLSKYVRIVQWCARRGTLQEELTKQIADMIMKHTGSEDVGVHIIAKHGCMENRGVMAHSSSTQTTVLHGQFYNPSVKQEWMDQVKMQIQVEPFA